MEKKFCPICSWNGDKTKIFILSDPIPLRFLEGNNKGYYDKEGDYRKFSQEELNKKYIYYQCSFGHKWAESEDLDIIFLK